jgi:hypothetical protein
MERGGHRRFRPAGIDGDDPRPVPIPHHPFPQNRVGDAHIAADQHDRVGLFKVSVGKWRGVETECLFVGDDGARHALACVAIAVPEPHAEPGERTKKTPVPRSAIARCRERRCSPARGRREGF